MLLALASKLFCGFYGASDQAGMSFSDVLSNPNWVVAVHSQWPKVASLICGRLVGFRLHLGSRLRLDTLFWVVLDFGKSGHLHPLTIVLIFITWVG